MEQRPEIIIALVAPLGIQLDRVSDTLRGHLARSGYTCAEIRLSETFKQVGGIGLELPESPEGDRLSRYMDFGSHLRESTGLGEAVAGIGLAKLRAARARLGEPDDPDQPVDGAAYVLRSLKHVDEVRTLRAIYGDQLVVVGATAERRARVLSLASAIAHSQGDLKPDGHLSTAEKLVAKDEKEAERPLGQNVSDTFPQADYFIDASSPQQIEVGVERLMRLLFGDLFLTPTQDETGMFHAQAAAYRSSAMGRQVGASILDAAGDLRAVGMNEAPRSGGGQYWPSDTNDGRDWAHLGEDGSDRIKRVILVDVLRAFQERGWLNAECAGEDLETLLEAARSSGGPLRDTWLTNLTEFGRDVHAEVSAIISMARVGVATVGTTLYCTTFPCHNCAKHIVAAGISRVVYREPYVKSFARDFHPDAIETDDYAGRRAGVVHFQPFVGVAPRRYASWFEMLSPRKDRNGKAVRWSPLTARPRVGAASWGYVEGEKDMVREIVGRLREKGYSLRDLGGE